MGDADEVRRAFTQTGAQAVMLARGTLGNPWLFAQLVQGRERKPSPEEVLAELDWVIDRAVEHLGETRATRYLRKFYPWYVGRVGLDSTTVKRLQEELQTAATIREARELLDPVRRRSALPV
jgi:tRNA-dihydrouridine synthase